MLHQAVRLPGLLMILSAWLLPGVPGATAETRDGRPRTAVRQHLPTYRFTARITANGGVTPFKVGEVIHGTFSYALDGRDRPPNARELGHFDSPRNALTFQVGRQRFRGAGRVMATVAVFKHAEHVGVVAHDLVLPPGWAMDHTVLSQSYGVLFQNAPSRKVLPGKQLPPRLSLPDFVNTRELRLDFFHGIRFPGGQVNGRATVHATVETLEAVR